MPVVLFGVIGCDVQQTKPSYRSSVELGKTLPQVWLAANKPRFDLINESFNNGCKEQVYRFWFDKPQGDRGGNNVGDPYLLVFRDCAIADEAAVSAERKRRADAWLASNPSMAKDVEKVSQEQGLSQTNKETLIELLAPDIYGGLPRPGAGSVLVKIDYDAETSAGIQDQLYRQQNLNHLQRMEELKKQELQQQQMDRQMDNLNRPTHIRPDGRGGYIVD